MFCPIQTFSSVHLSHVWICNPMDHSTPGFCVHHQLVECSQPHVHWVGDAIQPSHPLSSPSPPAFSLSQHQVFSKKSLHQVAKVLELQLQHQSFQRLCRTDFLSDWLVWSPCKSKELSRPSVPFRGNTVAIHGEGNGTHSSALAWKIPWTEEPGGCSPWGCKELDMTEQLHFHFSPPCTEEGSGNPLQCSCLENPRDGGAWWAAIYGVAQSRTRLKQLSSSSNSSGHTMLFIA